MISALNVDASSALRRLVDMKRHLLLPLLLISLGGLLAGCGDDDSSDGGAGESAAAPSGETVMQKKAKAPEQAATKNAGGPEIVVTDSDFGRILVDSEDQAIYIFENDEPGRSNCSGECAVAWPPVVTESRAIAGSGVDPALLGTTERGDGATQVTYDGQPLYYYAHEGPGEVRCHDVNLNGGYWWVIGPDGKRRP